MRQIVRTNQFKRDFKRILASGRNLAKFREAVGCLAEDRPLPVSFRDHPLTGNWNGFRECHLARIFHQVGWFAELRMRRFAQVGFGVDERTIRRIWRLAGVVRGTPSLVFLVPGTAPSDFRGSTGAYALHG
jgi:addiction module RelE/StbE family toxin